MQPELIENTTTFAELSLDQRLLRAVDKLGFTQPTPVQQQAIPFIIEGKDVLVSAETGSGKTAAFILPVLQRLLDTPVTLFGTRALILSPTRELAQQTYNQCVQLAEFTDLRAALITGGTDFKQQQGMIRRNTEILVATPGRLLELLAQDGTDFSHLDVLVLDEADRLLDMGFSDAVLTIADRCNVERQTLLFSATLTHYGVIKIADKVMQNHYKVVALNTLHDGHSNIEQQMLLADGLPHKERLLEWLLLNEKYDKALVFTNTRKRAEELYNFGRGKNLRVGLLHGELDHRERQRTMRLYRDGIVSVIIATDLAARGLDVGGLNLVINFDAPRNGIDYIHRIGRTGRADELGRTVVLVDHREWNIVAGIQRFLKQKFERRSIEGLMGSYNGPKKIKASGQAAGSKSKVEEKKVKKEKVKIRDRDKKNIGKRRMPKNKPETIPTTTNVENSTE